MPTLLDSHLENRTRLQPWHANALGTVHGGKLVVLLDDLATLSASRHAGTTTVTARVDGVRYHDPLEPGDTLLSQAYVVETGSTSLTVHVRGCRENPTTGDTTLAVDGSFVFVAVDDGDPVEVPPLAVDTDRGEELRTLALETTDDA
ncbi:acyl-CoA thioesterase [Halobacteriales archaeon Cl-PHB]